MENEEDVVEIHCWLLFCTSVKAISVYTNASYKLLLSQVERQLGD